MKRNLDLARAILLAVEQSDGQSLSTEDIVVGEYTTDEIRYNAGLLLDQSYLTGEPVTNLSDPGPPAILIESLTWAGHDFLDVSRSDDNWSAAKNRAGKVGGTLTFELMKELLVAIVKDKLGLPAG